MPRRGPYASDTGPDLVEDETLRGHPDVTTGVLDKFIMTTLAEEARCGRYGLFVQVTH